MARSHKAARLCVVRNNELYTEGKCVNLLVGEGIVRVDQ